MNTADPITLEIFKNLFVSAADEMGVTLGRTAYSPNIKERRDFSCACFLAEDGGRGAHMIAQAAHIPVHLGAMPASVQAAIETFEDWQPGDLVVLNDPYLGGTHLPDITMVSPVFIETAAAKAPALHAPEPADGQRRLVFFAASRAHHADVGGMSPGSMPLASEIYQEGLIIPPVKLVEAGRIQQGVLDLILRNVRTPAERRGDLAAQMAAHRVGEQRLQEIVARYGLEETVRYARALLDYAERLTRTAIAQIPDGTYTFVDEMDDGGLPEGAAGSPVAHSLAAETDGGPQIHVTVTVQGDSMTVDFSGSSAAVPGPLNAVRAITESATWYVVCCVTGAATQGGVVNGGTFRPVHVIVPRGSLLDAEPPHAVAGGNVETSQRVVDAVLGALAQPLPHLIPAASLGTMNNLTVGGHDPERGERFAYYETVGGGAGAGPAGDGLSGVHVHMTNTLNTPVEALEYAYPLRVRRYALRPGSGGKGLHRGGDGLVREVEFLSPAVVTILSERRRTAPYGLGGADPGARGKNLLTQRGTTKALPGKVQTQVEPGDVLSLRTPGGGGWGTAPEPRELSEGE
ncbi:MAG: hydantoinase B/oxoprolinase family protein [Anaerolineae bacterium]|nr:hydantoinase B/oxoprolinase family protein [Anaerolineae bacterium]